MPDCASTAVIQDFVSRDSGRLWGEVVSALISRSPWIDIYPSDTLDNNMGNSFRSSVQERAVLAGSLVNPAFVNDVSMCSIIPAADLSGEKEFAFQLGTFRGRSNKICIKQARTAFKTAYLKTTESLKGGVTRIVDAEARGQALTQSGTKAVASSTASLGTLITGGELAIATPFAGSIAPDSAPTFKLVKSIANYMRNTLHLNPFSTQNGGAMVKTIFSDEVTDRFRDEIDTRADLRAALTGRYKLGEQLLNSYEYEGPYREIGFAVDPQPLRAIAVSGGSGAVLSPTTSPFTTSWVPGYAPTDTSTLKLAFVEPEIKVATTNGFGSRANPVWADPAQAVYEVGFIMFDDSFTRLTPKVYAGEGDIKFPRVVGLEELQWAVILDNDCNRFGDTGDFAYEITRAYVPEHPEAICALIYKRCPTTTGLVAC